MEFRELIEVDGLVYTLNRMGYMTKTLDSYSQNFINYCMQLPENSNILEVGAAFGVATFQALKTNVNVFCNDLDHGHLNYIWKMANDSQKERLHLFPGNLEELNFPEKKFSAILASRVLHLITGEKLRKILNDFYRWLKPGGCLYIISDTPYLKPFKSFLPLYHKSKENGYEWPGLIENTSNYQSHELSNIPSFINFLDKDILIREFEKQKFLIKECDYVKIENTSFLFGNNGKEMVGIIGQKID